jgi:cysteinyl-tRNA synthetase
MNITDVGHLSGDNDEGDDKMLKSAEERGKTVWEVADLYTQRFFQDTQRLNIQKPRVICKATEHIADMIALIQRIEERGFTYRAAGNLYFDITMFSPYGELGRLRLEDQKAGARIGIDKNKRNPQDFVLWFTKSKFEKQVMLWDSPWGRGYPGWHIECSAMSIKYLGETFDIHAGGIDHVPIHHTNEIAQSEAATGKHPWVRYWIHNEFLVLDKGKMSKSTGGFLTLQSLMDAGYDPLDYRYFLLGAHYRSQVQFSYEALTGARNARKSLMDRIRERMKALGNREPLLALQHKPLPPSFTEGKAGTYLAAFTAALEDDLATPRGLAELWGILRDPTVPARDALLGAVAMDEVLGLKLVEEAETPVLEASQTLRDSIEALITERAAAKMARDFARADQIRQILKEQGIMLEDRPTETVWRRG